VPKIQNQFDKRTGSELREQKLKELKSQYPFLFDGGELKLIKSKTLEWIKQLQSVPQRGNSKSAPRKVKSPFERKHSNSTPALGGSFPPMRQESVDNPQESDSSDVATKRSSSIRSNRKKSSSSGPAATVKWDEEVAERDDRQPNMRLSFRAFQNSSVHVDKEARLLQRRIERVTDEIYNQQKNSPFFERKPQRNPPPSFLTSEVELDKELGMGEFCKIYEVTAFNVEECCHICFLHRGFKDAIPSAEASLEKMDGSVDKRVDTTNHSNAGSGEKKVPDSFRDGKLQTINGDMAVSSQNNLNQPKKLIKIFSFDQDDNISDYDELESDHEDDGYDHETRGFMKDHCLRNGEARYAVKRIRSNLVGEDNVTDASIDLAREAQFLAGLSHPNIIKVRGTINSPGHPNYGMILDRLYDTLEVQIQNWKVDVKQSRGKFMGLIGKNKDALKKSWSDRLLASYDLAHGMAYLHSHDILHRDLKPANIGFDVRGDIKIFDFGLAKELKPIDCTGQDQYYTSGMAGTRRYMAPEVAQVIHYGLPADVYSFGILVWEMLSLKPAFFGYSREKHYKEVVVEGKRPKIPKSWPFVTRNLLERCWAPDPSERPSFQAVLQLIRFGLPDDKIGSERSKGKKLFVVADILCIHRFSHLINYDPC
jgi:serine/threonine protein kinase